LYDYYLISAQASDEEGLLRLKIAEHEEEVSYIDHVELFAIDAPVDRRVTVDNYGTLFVLTEPLLAASIVDDAGNEQKAALEEFDSQKFTAVGPGSLVITYQPPASGLRGGSGSLDANSNWMPSGAAEAPPGGEVPPPGKTPNLDKVTAVPGGLEDDSASGSLLVEIGSDRSGWEVVDQIYPRIAGGTRFLDFSKWVPSSDIPFQVKYSWTREYSADALALYRYEKLDPSGVQPVKMISATHSHQGDVRAAIEAPDEKTMTLVSGEDVDLILSPTEVASAKSVRRYLLKVQGYYEKADTARLGRVISTLPAKFSLEQNYPNPFNPSTRIDYALPVESDVSLQIFNLLGQLVRTLVSGDRPAGYHSVEWDGRDNSGRLVGSGLYFFRLSTEEFVQTRKMVLLR